MTRLVGLALRRTLPPWLLVALALLLALAARGSGMAPVELDAHGAAGVRALARQNAWSVLAALAPLFCFLAARLGTSAERAWLGPTPVRASALSAALGLGCVLAASSAAFLAALAGELAVAGDRPTWRTLRALEAPPAVLMDATPRAHWRIPALAPGERLRLEVGVTLGAGPAATARLGARSAAVGSPAESAVEARVSSRTRLELEPPVAGAEGLELELERVGSGAVLVLGPGALTVLGPVASERRGALALGLRVGLALAAGCALALGLGSVLRPALAAGLVLALQLWAWTHASRVAWVPGADLPLAWQELGRGLAPAPVAPAAFAGALGAVALGLALQARSFRRAGGAP